NLAKSLRSGKPAVVQTWMYHADLFGGLAARLGGNVPVVWGIRNGVLDQTIDKKSTIRTAQLCAWLSPWIPKRIICCSERARTFHQSMGYCRARIIVIPNGFDLGAFKPDPEARATLRRELRVSKEALVVGVAGRFDQKKGHQNLICAARQVI